MSDQSTTPEPEDDEPPKDGSDLSDASCSMFYVWHPEAADLGLISPKFSTYAEARDKAREWNKEIGGHKVLKITDANAELSCSDKSGESKL